MLTDRDYMARALFLAERGRGRTSPNPMVGAVVVSSDGVVVGHGYHHRAGEALLVLPRSLVEDHGRHLLPRQREGEREPHGPRSDDDHRVHGAAPPARRDVPADVGEQKVGAGCTITERMQPIAGACVK